MEEVQRPAPVRKAIEAYSNSGALRAAAQLVPVFGPVLDSLFGAWGAELARARVMALVEELRAKVDSIEVAKIDEEYLQTEEFADVLMRAVREALQTRHREKLEVLAAVVAGSAVVDRAASLPAEEALTALGGLSVREIQLALMIHDQSTIDQPLVSLPELHRGGTFAPDNDIRFQVQRLVGAGLVEQDRDLLVREGQVEPARFLPTPTLRSVVQMIRAGRGL